MVVNPMEAEDEVFMEKPKTEEKVQPHVEQPVPKVNRSRYANNYIEESSITQLE